MDRQNGLSQVPEVFHKAGDWVVVRQGVVLVLQTICK
jgi:hypothetical protein